MEDILDSGDVQDTGKLPIFLKVLCILTFVGAGLGLLGGLYNMLMFDSVMKQLEQTQSILNDSPFGSFNGIIEATKKWGMLSYSLTTLGNALCIVGALMMWKLKKVGFFTYVVGELMPLVGSILLVNAMGDSGSGSGIFAFSGMIGVVIAGIFYLAFIIMYAVNLKHLK